MAKKKKSKKKFDQSFRKSMKPDLTSEDTPKKPERPRADLLDPGTRTGFILMGYLLFIAGSIGCLVLGYAGAEKRGSYEVRLIGWLLIIVHALFIVLLSIDAGTMGIIPIQIALITLVLLPFVFIIIGLAGRNALWGHSIRSIGLTILIPNLIVIWLANPSILWDEIRANEIITRSNINQLSNSLNRYEMDHEGTFPQSFDEVIEKNYIESIPTNPFTGMAMKHIDFGEVNFEGNFTYLPVEMDKKIVGYYLLGYGDRSNPGQDVTDDGEPNNVISVIKMIGGGGILSGLEYQEVVLKFPTLSEVLSEK